MTQSHTGPEQPVPARYIGLAAGAVAFLGILFFADLEPGKPEVTRMAAVAVLMAIWWMTEAIPLAVTAMLPVFLYPVLGILHGKETASIYCNHVVFLFIGGFIVALCIEKWNLHKRIALRTLQGFGSSYPRMMLGFMVSTAFLSMWISNTATAMMMIPIAMAVMDRLKETQPGKKLDRYAKGLYLCIAFSASIGGIATLVGTPPNMVFVRIFEESFPAAPQISFGSWFFFALPLSIVFLGICWLLLYFLYRPRGESFHMDPSVIHNELSGLGPLSRPEKRISILALILILFWLFRADLRFGLFTIPGWSNLLGFALGDPSYAKWVTDGSVAIAIAVLLFVVPSGRERGEALMDWNSAVKLPWGIVLLFGGGFALAAGFKATGLSEWLGGQLHGLDNVHPVILIATICLLATFLTEITSNTGTTQILLPIMISAAAAMNVHPLLFMIPATLSCSFAFMLPVATPPNAIVFATREVHVLDMARPGIVLNLLGVVLITLAVFTMGDLVLGIDSGLVPDWVK